MTFAWKKYATAFVLIAITLSVCTYSQVKFETSVKTYMTQLDKSEKDSYIEYVNFKNKFKRQSTSSIYPKTFQPQDPNYMSGIFEFNIVYFALGGLVTVLCIVYCILRFVFLKCVGPISLKQVNKNYKIISWIILIGAVISFIVISIVLMVPSISLG